MRKGTDKHSHRRISSIPIAWRQSPPITPCRGCAPRRLPGALRDELERGGEFSIGRPYFGFAVAGSYRRRKSWRGRHHDLFDDTARSDPCPRIPEGPREIADIIGQLPRRVDTLPMQNISLDSKNQQEVLPYQR